MIDDGILPAILFGLVAGVLLVLFLLIGLNGGRSMVDVDALGEILCEEAGLSYDRYEINEDYVPKIYCVNPEKKVIDGIVVVE